jgi:hypothetical protein
MLVKMTVGLAGPAYTLNPGDEREFPQDEAMRLVAAGFAVPVSELKIERAIVDAPVERRKKRETR